MTVRRTALLILCLWAVAGCGSEGLSATPAEHEASTTGRETTTIEPERTTIGASEALDGAPLDQSLGSPFFSDGRSLWYSDFHQLARRDLVTGAWSVQDFPYPDGRIGSLAFSPDGKGALRGLAGICAEACEEGVDIELRAWTATTTSEPSDVPIEGTFVLDPGFFLMPLPEGGPPFGVANGSSTLLVFWEDGPSVQAVPGAYPLLCSTSSGPTGIESVLDTGADIPPRRVVTGPDLLRLTALAIPAEVDQLLADFDASAICTHDGMAVVGPTQAFELRDGTWSEVPSDVGVSLSRQHVIGLPAFGRDGAVVQAGLHANLRRDGSGWHLAGSSADRPSGYAVVGRGVASYPAGSTDG